MRDKANLDAVVTRGSDRLGVGSGSAKSRSPPAAIIPGVGDDAKFVNIQPRVGEFVYSTLRTCESETCDKTHDGSFGKGRFCSSACARRVGGIARTRKMQERNEKAAEKSREGYEQRSEVHSPTHERLPRTPQSGRRDESSGRDISTHSFAAGSLAADFERSESSPLAVQSTDTVYRHRLEEGTPGLPSLDQGRRSVEPLPSISDAFISTIPEPAPLRPFGDLPQSSIHSGTPIEGGLESSSLPRIDQHFRQGHLGASTQSSQPAERQGEADGDAGVDRQSCRLMSIDFLVDRD